MKQKAGSIIATLLAIALFLGIRACTTVKDVSDSFKEAKSFLKEQGYEVRLYDENDDINEMLAEMFGITAQGVIEALLAYNEKADDAFVMVRCEDTVNAEYLEFDLIDFVILDNLDTVGYTVERNYTTVYMGYEDIVKSLNK